MSVNISEQRFTFTCRHCQATRTAMFTVSWPVKRSEKRSEAARSVEMKLTRWGPECISDCVQEAKDRMSALLEPCCDNEQRSMAGGCVNCGDPCL